MSMLLGTATARISLDNSGFLRGIDQALTGLRRLEQVSSKGLAGDALGNLNGIGKQARGLDRSMGVGARGLGSFDDDLGRVTRDVDTLGGSMGVVERRSSSFGKRMSGMGGALSGASGLRELIGFTGITAPVIGGLGKMTGMASDLGEAVNKNAVVFGASAGVTSAWADKSADAFGISESAALSQAATFGNLFTGMGLSQDAAAGMSTEMLGLAADLASFNNVPVDQALAAIQSGLVGEAEPMRQFGVLLNETTVGAKAMEMGLGDANGLLTEQEKVLARNALIMEQTTNAQGDFARTSTGLANTQRILGANLADIGATVGGVLLPAVTGGAQALSGFLDIVGDLGRPFQVAAVGVGVFAAAIGPVLLVAGQLVTSFSTVKTAMSGFKFAGMLSGLGPMLPLLLGIGLAFAAYKTNFLGFGDAVRGVVSGVVGFIGDVKAAWDTLSGPSDVMQQINQWGGVASRAAGFSNVFARGLGAVSLALRNIGGGDIGWINAIADGLDGAAKYVQKFVDAWNSFDANNGISDTMETVNKWGGTTAKQMGVFDRFVATLGKMGGAAKTLGGILGFVGDHFSTIAKGVGIAVGAFVAFQAVTGVIGLVAAGIGLLLSPIGLVIGGAVLLATAWTKNWGDIQGKTAAVVDFLQGSVWPVIQAGIQGVIIAWNMLKAAWDVGGIAGVGGTLVSIFGAIASQVMGAVRGGLQGLSNMAMEGLQGMADNLALGLQLAWDAMTAINWSDHIPGLSWALYVGDLLWDGFVTAVDLAMKVGAFAWNVFVTAVDLAAKVGAFAWDVFVTAVDLATKVGAFAWDVFVTAVDLAAEVGAFAWDVFVTAVDLAGKVGAFAWSTFVTVVDLGTKVASLAWNGFVTAVDLGVKAVALLWSTFVTAVDLGTKVVSLLWSGFVTSVNLGLKVASLVWSGFVTSVDLATKVGAFAWSSFVTAVDLAAAVGEFAWSSFVTAVNLGDEVGDFAWSSFVTGVDLAEKVGEFAWSGYVTAVDLSVKVGEFTWSTFVTAVDLSAKIGAFAWSTFVTAVDLTTNVATLTWSSFVTALTAWSDYIADISWSTFVPDVSWSTFIPTLSWPSKDEILGALTGGLIGGGEPSAEDQMQAEGRSKVPAQNGGGGAPRDRWSSGGISALETPNFAEITAALKAESIRTQAEATRMTTFLTSLFQRAPVQWVPPIATNMNAIKAQFQQAPATWQQPVSTAVSGIRTVFTSGLSGMAGTTNTQFGAMKGAAIGQTVGMRTGVIGAVGGMAGGVVGSMGGMVGGVIGRTAAMAGGAIGQAGGMRTGVIGSAAGMQSGVLGSIAGMAGGVIGQAAGMNLGATGQAGAMRGGVVGSASGMALGALGAVAGMAGGVTGQAAGMNIGASGQAAGMSGSVIGSAAGMSGGVLGSVAGMAGGTIGQAAAMAGGASGEAAGMSGSVIGSAAAMAGGATGSAMAMAAGVIGGATQATGGVTSNASSWPGIVGGVAGAMASAGQAAGSAAGMGVAAGMQSALGAVRAAAGAIVSAVNGALRAAAKIASPSKLTADVGRMLTQGVAVGLRAPAMLRDVMGSASQVVDIVGSAMRRPPSGIFTESANWTFLGREGFRTDTGALVKPLGQMVGAWEKMTHGYWRNVQDDHIGIIKGIRAEDGSYVNPGFFGDLDTYLRRRMDTVYGDMGRTVRGPVSQLGDTAGSLERTVRTMTRADRLDAKGWTTHDLTGQYTNAAEVLRLINSGKWLESSGLRDLNYGPNRQMRDALDRSLRTQRYATARQGRQYSAAAQAGSRPNTGGRGGTQTTHVTHVYQVVPQELQRIMTNAEKGAEVHGEVRRLSGTHATSRVGR